MSSKDDDLHGNAPDTSAVALLVIDMINDLEWPGGEKILDSAVEVADRIADLAREARVAGVPVIFANDNFGRWRSDFREVVEHCLSGSVRGRELDRAADARSGRLFRAQAETLRILRHHA